MKKLFQIIQSLWENRTFLKAFAFASGIVLVLFLVIGGFFTRISSEYTAKKIIQDIAKEGMPTNGRISGIGYYAVYSSTRGESQYDLRQIVLKPIRHNFEVDAISSPEGYRHHILGKFYLAEGKFIEAYIQLNLALSFFKDDAQLNNDLGICLIETGEGDITTLEEALKYIQRARQLDPNLLEAIFNEAWCYEVMKNSAAAKNTWEVYLKRDLTSPWAARAKARLSALQ